MNKELNNDLITGNINHAYFLECNNEETGIDEAKEFARGILKTKIESNPDCIILNVEEKSIKVDAIRDLEKSVFIKPFSSERKIYIIPQADKMNISAQNSLLKTLEEPPEYVTIILIAPSVYSVTGTVRSRVKRIKINLKEEVKVQEEVKELLNSAGSLEIVQTLKFSEFFEKNKENIIGILHEMLLYCNEKMLDTKNELPGRLKRDTIDFARYVPVIDLAERRINENSNFSMTVDELLLSLAGK